MLDRRVRRTATQVTLDDVGGDDPEVVRDPLSKSLAVIPEAIAVMRFRIAQDGRPANGVGRRSVHRTTRLVT